MTPRTAGSLEFLLNDLGYGLRTLRKSPGFTALAVLTLALGTGAATAVFSLVNAALLRALPYRDPQRLVFLWEPNPHFPGAPIEVWSPFNADFYDWQKQAHSFSSLGLFTTDRMNLSGGTRTVRVAGSRVTGDFFRTLGVLPELGRAIEPDDDQPGQEQVAVISRALWQSRFGSDLGVLSKSLTLDAHPHRIIGVMPTGFAFPHGNESLDTVGITTDVWVPWAMTPQERASRQNNQGNAVGRLRPGVSPAQAQAEMSAIVARLDPLHLPMFRGSYSVVQPIAKAITGSSRRTLLIFMGAVLLVLLIASSNVASLVLARANGRTREISVRAALGASRLRLVRELAAESLCLAAAGGLLGAVAASAAIRLLIHFRPVNIPRIEDAVIDWRVLGFAASASLVAAVLAGLLPAWTACRADLNEVLKRAGSRSVKGRSARFERGLLVAQVALSFVLLAGSGLLIRSFLKVQAIDKGFDARATLTMSIQLDARYNTPERQHAFWRNLTERSGALPGVEDAAVVNQLPLGGGETVGPLTVEGHPFEEKTIFELRAITPRYFAAMGIPLLAGRAFTDGDMVNRSTEVAIVSRSFARNYFPGGQAVGKRLSHDGTHSSWQTIVGVVPDVRQYGLETTPPMEVYEPLSWLATFGRGSVVLRTRAASDRIASEMRTLLRTTDPALALADIRTMDQVVSQATSERRFQTFLLTAFSGAALFLSLVGLYGLMAQSVERRTAEIGIRMALGAQRRTVLRLVLTEGSKLAVAGIALGLACAWAFTRYLSSLLFAVSPTDAPSFLGAAILFGAVALAACYFPARRATRIDPAISLRYE